jgi:hypothetical protein
MKLALSYNRKKYGVKYFLLFFSALPHVYISFIQAVTSVSKLGVLKLLARSFSSYSVHAETTYVNTFRFYAIDTEYVAIWKHIQCDVLCFWIEEFSYVQYSCFKSSSCSSRPKNSNKSLTILYICNCNIKAVALKTYSNTFQVLLNFVNLGMTGKKNTPAQYVHLYIHIYVCVCVRV